jgi:3,4-dihydroxy-2-butanone 4-phosphate synthase
MDSHGLAGGGARQPELREEESEMMAAGEAEAELIRYCARVAVGVLAVARNEREANVLAVAPQVMRPRFSRERANLSAACVASRA